MPQHSPAEPNPRPTRPSAPTSLSSHFFSKIYRTPQVNLFGEKWPSSNENASCGIRPPLPDVFLMAQLPCHSLTLGRCYAIHAPSANFSRGAEGEHRGDATVHGLVEVEGSIRGQENDAFVSLEGHEGRDEQRCGLPWPNESDEMSKKALGQGERDGCRGRERMEGPKWRVDGLMFQPVALFSDLWNVVLQWSTQRKTQARHYSCAMAPFSGPSFVPWPWVEPSVQRIRHWHVG